MEIVFQLRQEIPFSNDVSKIDYLRSEPNIGEDATVIGWGDQNVRSVYNPLSAINTLQIVTLKTISQQSCRDKIEEPGILKPSHICTEGEQPNQNVYFVSKTFLSTLKKNLILGK